MKWGKIAWNLPAVERHFITTEMNVSVFEHLHYFGKQSPQKPVRFAQYWVDWAKQAVRPIPVVIARCQQMVLSITPWESMPYIRSNSHGVNKQYFSMAKKTISLQPNNNPYHRHIKASAAHSIGNQQIFYLSPIFTAQGVLTVSQSREIITDQPIQWSWSLTLFQPESRQSNYTWIALYAGTYGMSVFCTLLFNFFDAGFSSIKEI